ncbi:MAG: hypothetical protein KF878_10265 [Planctomycetes bacterium]|nr:hypothetical protein [Planctomycetota bacterium]
MTDLADRLPELRSVALDPAMPLAQRVEAARAWLACAEAADLDLSLRLDDPTAPGWQASEMAGVLVLLELPEDDPADPAPAGGDLAA